MPHPTKRPNVARIAAACCAALFAAIFSGGARAQNWEATPPDAVRIPAGLNLGETSFYDGLVDTKPGLTLITYASRQALDEITGSDGRPAPMFNHPRIDVSVAVIQLVYVAHEFEHGCLGLSMLQPIVNFDSSFRTPGVVLRDNGLGFGDQVIGPFYQSKPVRSGGRPIFYWRVEMDVIAPFGSFNSATDVNQGSRFASFNPYVSFSYLPTSKFEISGRAHYLYNFATDRAPNPPPGLTFRNGQAGQATWLNFAASYEVAQHFSLGVNGYYLAQLTDDRFNGLDVPRSKAESLYLGPGMHWAISAHGILNVNYYFPVSSRNLPQGQKINMQYIHPF